MSNLKRHCCLRPEQYDGKRGHSCDNKSIRYPLTFYRYKYYYEFNHVTSSLPDKIYIWLKYSPFLPVRCLRRSVLVKLSFTAAVWWWFFRMHLLQNTKARMQRRIWNANREYEAFQRAIISITYLIKPYLKIIWLMDNDI